MLVLSILYEEMTALLADSAAPALKGLTAAVTGILAATIYRLAKPTITTLTGGVVAVGACAFGIVLGINPAWIVLAAGILGVWMPLWFVQGPRAGASGDPEKQS